MPRSRGCTVLDDPSFQYECCVLQPHDGHLIEPGGNRVGCVMYGLHTITNGRKKSCSCTSGSPRVGMGGVNTPELRPWSNIKWKGNKVGHQILIELP